MTKLQQRIIDELRGIKTPNKWRGEVFIRNILEDSDPSVQPARRTVQYALKELADDGHIEWRLRRGRRQYRFPKPAKEESKPLAPFSRTDQFPDPPAQCSPPLPSTHVEQEACGTIPSGDPMARSC